LLKIENQTAEILGLKKIVMKVEEETSALPLYWARNLLARYEEAMRLSQTDEKQAELLFRTAARRGEADAGGEPDSSLHNAPAA
jgi:hypothetical protein